MSEILVPSGYVSSKSLRKPLTISSNILPWVDQPFEASVASCELQGGGSFLLASVIKSHPRLIKAAEGMTKSQKNITDNMFYSRIAGFMQDGIGQGIGTMTETTTDFPVRVMRNKGGQRVYFGSYEFKSKTKSSLGRVILRLAVCDKNKQSDVMSVLSGSDGARIKRSGR